MSSTFYKTWLLFVGSFMVLSLTEVRAQTKSPLKSRLPQTWSSPRPSPSSNARVTQYSPKTSKVSPDLWALSQEYEQNTNRNSWSDYVEEKQYDETLVLSDEKVMIEAVAEQDTEALKARLERLGLERASAFGRMVSGWFPLASVPQLEQIKELRFVRPSYRPAPRAGVVTSQGDAAQGSDLARNVCGLNGAGTTVGILSDSYNALGGEEEGIESGDLPGPGNPNENFNPTIILSDLDLGEDPGLIDEGRAMAEIVHDVVPRATLAFHTAFAGQPDFANGILRLASDVDSDVIVDDVFYFAEPFFQDGIVAQAVDQVKNAGVTYLSSAGNQARQSYESAFRPAPDTTKLTGADSSLVGDYILHDFDPGPGVDVFQRITVPFGTTISFQWSQAYASICEASEGADSDLDIFIFTREDFNSPIFGSTFGNVGGDPFEFLSVSTDFSVEAYLVIGKFIGIPEFGFEAPGPNPNPERIKYVYFGGDMQEEYATNSSTVTGHANAAGAIAVGAVPYFNTPAFGVEDPILESFSSAGGSSILLTPCGEPVASQVREKPEICGPDGGNNTFFGGDAEGDGFPNFFGTSASAPHVAGIVALMEQAAEDIGPDSTESILQRTALDMDDPFTPGPDPGFDFGTGYGLVRGVEALSQLTQCAGVARLELYNADTDSLVAVLNDGDSISREQTTTRNLAIRAITIPEKVGSVQINISGGLISRQVENFAPYASFGDNNNPRASVDYTGREFPFGSFSEETFTVEATAYAQPNAQGDVLGSLSLSFSLVEELLTAFTLIDATTREPITELSNFLIVNQSQTGDNLNIRAEVATGATVGSVEFVLQETDIVVEPTGLVLERTENTPPFTALNEREDLEGVLGEAFYLLTATPYREDNLQGDAGPPLSVIFAVSDDGGLPDPDTTVVAQAPLVVYPNPITAQSTLQVRWQKADATPVPATFRLLNGQSETVYQQQTDVSGTNGVHPIDLSRVNLSRGLYYLRVEIPGVAPQVVRVRKE